MIENLILGYLYNELFRKNNEEKCTVFQNMALSLIVQKNTIKNCSTALQAFSLWYLSQCILYFLFHKSKDTSEIPQPSFQYIANLFPIFFRFHKSFNNFHLSKNISINKFFHWNVFFYSFTSKTQGRCQVFFEVK